MKLDEPASLVAKLKLFASARMFGFDFSSFIF